MITIPKKIYDSIIRHAEAGYPNEACGIVAGQASGQVTEFFPMKNADESGISFFIDPKEQIQVFKKIRERGNQMLGIFHSHTAGEACPSKKDIRLASYSEASYLIASLADGKKSVLRSFKIKDEAAKEEEIKIV